MVDNLTHAELKRRLAAAEREIALLRREAAEIATASQNKEGIYRSLFDSIDEGLLILELIDDEQDRAIDLRWLESNRALDRHTGMPDLVGKRMSDVIPGRAPDDLKILDEICRTGEAQRREHYNEFLGRWYRVFVARIGGSGSRRVVQVLSDITAQKRAEQALRDGEEQQRLMLQLVPVLPWRASPDGTDIFIAEQWKGYTGQTDEEIQNFGWLDAIHPDDLDASRIGFEHAFATGEPLELQHRIRSPDGGYRWHLVRHVPVRDDAGAILRWYGAAIDVHTLHQLEERQAFLLKISDALRSIADPAEIQGTAARLLGEQLDASRVFYVNVDKDGDTATILDDYTNGVPARVGRYLLSAFSSYAVDEWHAGRTASTSDVNADARYSEHDRDAYASVSTRASFGIPLIKSGRLVALLGVNQSTPRDWTEHDLDLASEIAERTWAATERARAEAALRESEERFQQFANASSSGIWIRNAETLAMEYVSPAIETIYGVSQKAFLGDMSRWAALIVPEDRDIALAHIEQARRGEPAIHEFRVQRPTDKAFRWIRNTDFPLYDAQGNIERVGGIAEDITEEKLAVEHQNVLLAELQHRVRNIMAVLRSIAARTAHGAETVEDYAALMADRLNTFARVQALLTRAANAGLSLGAIVDDELRALAAHAGQFETEGPDVELSPKAAETMTLAVHELTTNALKYGALSAPDGNVRVQWEIVEKQGDQWLVFDWRESGAPAQPGSDKPRRVGFGSELIEGRIPYELSGRGKVRIEESGAQCHLEFPLQEGASILETGAPQRATVFGGAIDMTGQADLTGQRILVVEDDYYLASDTARALQGAGATVLGPFATEDDARAEIADTLPTAAVLDINLRGGRSFDLAGDFKRDGVSFIFITGYDQDVIPESFEGVPRLQKPVEFRHVIGALADALDIRS